VDNHGDGLITLNVYRCLQILIFVRADLLITHEMAFYVVD